MAFRPVGRLQGVRGVGRIPADRDGRGHNRTLPGVSLDGKSLLTHLYQIDTTEREAEIF